MIKFLLKIILSGGVFILTTEYESTENSAMAYTAESLGREHRDEWLGFFMLGNEER